MEWRLKDGKTESQYQAAYSAAIEDNTRRIYEINEALEEKLTSLYYEFYEEIPETREQEGK